MGSRAGPLDVVPLLPEERGALLEVLASLDPEDWDRPTECPAWSVKGVALHVLGDDLSLLSRQRDGAQNGIVLEAARTGAPTTFRALLDAFNERWVDAAGFLGPPLVVELLQATGDLTHRWYAGVDPEERGEPVGLFGDGPAPYWQIAAREYLERWVHQAQIRRATDRPPLEDPALVVPALAVVARALVRPLDGLETPPGATVVLAVDDPPVAWTLERGEHGWRLFDGELPSPTVRLALPLPDAAVVFSRGVPRADVPSRLRAEGAADLVEPIVSGLAAVVGR